MSADSQVPDPRRLRAELEQARQRVAALEAQLAAAAGAPLIQRSPREPLTAAIEFIGEFDVVQARGVDLSAGGICFAVDHPLTFHMRFDLQGERHERRARLVWASSLPAGGLRLGLEFVELDRHPEF